MEGSYPTDWERGDANQFIAFRVGINIRSMQEVVDKISQARDNTENMAPPEAMFDDDGVQVSMKNSYGQTIVFGRIPEVLTWAEQNELAKLCGGTLMNNQMA
jgi:hypothetical protein